MRGSHGAFLVCVSSDLFQQFLREVFERGFTSILLFSAEFYDINADSLVLGNLPGFNAAHAINSGPLPRLEQRRHLKLLSASLNGGSIRDQDNADESPWSKTQHIGELT